MKAYAIATGNITDNGGYNFAESTRLPVEVYLNSTKPGTLLEISIVRKYPEKTKEQLGNIFGNMLNGVIAQANHEGIDVSDFLAYLIAADMPKGVGLTKDFLLELAYAVCPTVDGDGRRVTLSKMDTQQANQFFERFRALVAPLGIVIDDPRKDWRNA